MENEFAKERQHELNKEIKKLTSCKDVKHIFTKINYSNTVEQYRRHFYILFNDNSYLSFSVWNAEKDKLQIDEKTEEDKKSEESEEDFQDFSQLVDINALDVVERLQKNFTRKETYYILSRAMEKC
ncbi:MAG: hypothetical protein ACOC56_02850 [Atribacterota bacterium]